MASTREKLDRILLDITKVAGIESAVIASRNGLLIGADMPAGVRPETFAAMSATMLGAGETAILELGKGVTKRIIVELEHAKLIATGCGPKALLVALTASDAKLGLVLIELEKSASKITDILQ